MIQNKLFAFRTKPGYFIWLDIPVYKFSTYFFVLN